MKKSVKSLFAVCSLLCAFCVTMSAHADSPVMGAGGGGNLTAFRGSAGALNNNQWNNMMNPGKSMAAQGATADFGNCNALILRCATPKCGGCTSMELALPIVSGCVQSNPSCAQHGDALIQTLAAQMVSNATMKANEQAAVAQQAAAAAAAEQSNAAMEQMQQQMQQMQQQMSEQSAQSAMAVQQALEEQKQLAAQQAAAAAAQQAAAAAAAPEQRIIEAASQGVSADVIAREKIGGQIMSQIENAEVAMKDLQQTMQNVFAYARCDASGNNCIGPRRVKAFKNKANQFFEPYEAVLDEIYDALILAQSLGVDITDIYMMLNGSCSVWGKYMCEPCPDDGTPSEGHACTNGGNGKFFYEVKKISQADGSWKVDSKQAHCTLLNMITDQETVNQNWLDMEAGSSGGIRVACASDAIDNSALFRNRKKQATIDIETLQRILNQDSPSIIRDSNAVKDAMKYCSILDDKKTIEDGVEMLQTLVMRKSLTTPGINKVCVQHKELKSGVYNLSSGSNVFSSRDACEAGRNRTQVCVEVGNQWERQVPSRLTKMTVQTE